MTFCNVIIIIIINNNNIDEFIVYLMWMNKGSRYGMNAIRIGLDKPWGFCLFRFLVVW